ncbi:MAG: isocitrate lyase/phosphoenolpyruvate mutase family protein [Actinomycetota bacterium]
MWSLQTDLVDLRASLALIKEIVVSPTQDQKAADFRALHEGEAFLIPNPWDAGSARILEALGFKALASTSSGSRLRSGASTAVPRSKTYSITSER